MHQTSEHSIPIVSLQTELIALKDQASPGKDDFNPGATFLGVVSSTAQNKVRVSFIGGVSKSIKVKDLNNAETWREVYTVGKVVRVAVNKLERICTKEKVLAAVTDV